MITLEGITKRYDLGSVEVNALAGIDLTIGRGEFLTGDLLGGPIRMF